MWLLMWQGRGGADIVIAVNVGANVVNYEIGNLFDISLQAVNIMGNEIARFKIKGVIL